MPVVAGAIVPHAPLLLPELESPEVASAAAAIRDAVAPISFEGVDAIVLLTPHASTTGVYRETRGDLGAFGIPGIGVASETNDAVAAQIGLPVVDGSVDHGVVVPLRLGSWEAPVVAVGITGGRRPHLDDAALRLAVVASANGSTGMSPRAPLTELPGAARAQERFVAALSHDVATAAGIDLPGSCGAHVLEAFADLFPGRRANVLAYEAPVGVGYVVAEIA